MNPIVHLYSLSYIYNNNITGQLSQFVVKHSAVNSFPIAYIIDYNHIIQQDDFTNLPTAQRNTMNYSTQR